MELLEVTEGLVRDATKLSVGVGSIFSVSESSSLSLRGMGAFLTSPAAVAKGLRRRALGDAEAIGESGTECLIVDRGGENIVFAAETFPTLECPWEWGWLL